MFLRAAILGMAFAAAAAAQSWSFGIAGGGSLTDPVYNIITGPPGTFQERSFSGSKDYLAGLSIEHPLPANFSVEADVLFRELHMTTEGIEINGTPNSVSPSPVVTWEFPVLAKYRFRLVSKLDPFLEAGPSFRTTGNFNGEFPSHYGVTAGIGITAHWGAFEFAPAIRYTRWERDQQTLFSESKQDQVEVLLGVSRGTAPGSNGAKPRLSMGLAVGTSLVSDYQTLSGVPTTVLGLVTSPSGVQTVEPVPATLSESGDGSAMAGLAAEFGLRRNFYIEVDALHHPLCLSSQKVLSTGFVSKFAGCGVTWEVPFLAKLEFGSTAVRPFLEAGVSVRTGEMIGSYGFTAGAGVEIRAGVLRIAPGVRYTRWAPGAVPVTRNAVELVTEFLL